MSNKDKINKILLQIDQRHCQCSIFHRAHTREYSGHIVMQSSQDSHFRALVLYLPLDMSLSQLYTVKYSVYYSKCAYALFLTAFNIYMWLN